MINDPLVRLSTGIVGLDEIPGGGLIPARACLLRGEPGTGKTTLGLQFMKEAAGRGERWGDLGAWSREHILDRAQHHGGR